MVELGERLGFPAKAPKPLGVMRQLAGQDFERDVTIEFPVGRAIHLSHAA